MQESSDDNLILETKLKKYEERHLEEISDLSLEKDRLVGNKTARVNELKEAKDTLEAEVRALSIKNADLLLEFEKSSSARQYKIDTDSLKRAKAESRQECLLKDKEIEYLKEQ